MDKNLSGFKKCHRDSKGRLVTPYEQKRAQARGVRFPPHMDDWIQKQKDKEECSFNDLMIQAVTLLMKQKNNRKDK